MVVSVYVYVGCGCPEGIVEVGPLLPHEYSHYEDKECEEDEDEEDEEDECGHGHIIF